MIYSINVRNEQTGEQAILDVEGADPMDAQCRALMILFRERRWRKATAALPEDALLSGWEQEWQRFIDQVTETMQPERAA